MEIINNNDKYLSDKIKRAEGFLDLLNKQLKFEEFTSDTKSIEYTNYSIKNAKQEIETLRSIKEIISDKKQQNILNTKKLVISELSNMNIKSVIKLIIAIKLNPLIKLFNNKD